MKITINISEEEMNDYAYYHGYKDEIIERGHGKGDTIPNPQTKLEFFQQSVERHIKHGVATRRKDEEERTLKEATKAEIGLTVTEWTEKN